jgi:hypothetical protein
MYVAKNQRNWDQHLDHVLFAYRTSWHETLKESPFYMLYGQNPILPIDTELETSQPELKKSTKTYRKDLKESLNLAYNIAHYHTVKEQEKQKRNYDKKRTVTEYKIGDQVWVFTPRVKEGLSKKLATLWHGPYRIEKKYSNVNYKISRRNNETMKQRIHITRLKPYYSFDLRPEIIPELEEDDDFDIDIEYNEAIIDDPWIPDESMQQELKELDQDPTPMKKQPEIIESIVPNHNTKTLTPTPITKPYEIPRPMQETMLKKNFETIDKAITEAPIIEVSEQDEIIKRDGAIRGKTAGFDTLIDTIISFREVLAKQQDKSIPMVKKALIGLIASRFNNTYVSNDSRKAAFKLQINEASNSYKNLIMYLSNLTTHFDKIFEPEIIKKERRLGITSKPTYDGLPSKGKGVM